MTVFDELGWNDPDRAEDACFRLCKAINKATGASPEKDVLSPAEVRVVEAISHGVGGGGAAEILGLAPETVKSHLRRSKAKLSAKNTTHLVAKALRAGLIS